MKKFEYLTRQISLTNKELDELGAKGWELITHTAVVGNGNAAQYYVFKRRLESKKSIRLDKKVY